MPEDNEWTPEAQAQFQSLDLRRMSPKVMPLFAQNSNGWLHGSCVLVRYNDRHFAATAAHCLVGEIAINCPGAIIGERDNRLYGHLPYKVLQTMRHSTLDLGVMELDRPIGEELLPENLDLHELTKVDQSIHLIGFPCSRIMHYDLIQQKFYERNALGLRIDQINNQTIKCDYPTSGIMTEGSDWVETDLPITPHGFSGGGGFQFIRQEQSRGGIVKVEDRLLGIQSYWDSIQRIAVLIQSKHLVDLIKSIL